MNTLRNLLAAVVVLLFAQMLVAQGDTWKHFRSIGKVNEAAELGGDWWLATDHGVMRVNKSSHETTWFTKFNSTLVNEHVASVATSPTGDMWIGTYDVVLMRWNGTEFVDVPLPSNIAAMITYDTKMYCIRFAPNGDMWVGTDFGAIHKSGDNWEVITGADIPSIQNPTFFNKVWGIAFDDLGNTFIASNYLVRYDGTTFTSLTDVNGGFNLFAYSSAHLTQHDGYVYYINDVSDAAVLRGDSTYVESSMSELIPSVPGNSYSFNKGPNGELLVMSGYGAPLSWNLGSLTVSTDPFVTSLPSFPDVVCTDASGLHWATDKATLFWEQNALPGSKEMGDELSDNNIQGIVEDADGHIFCLNPPDNINSPSLPSVVDVYDYLTHSWSSAVAPASANALLKDHNGRIWLSAAAKLYRLENGAWLDVSAATNQPADIAYTYSFDAIGDHIWIAYNYRLYHYDGTSWQTFTPGNSGLFSQGYVQQLVAMPDGSAYVEQYKLGESQYYLHHVSNTTFSSVPVQATFGSGYLTVFHVAPSGELWAGDFSDLYHFNSDGTFETIDTADGWDFYSFSMTSTADGRLIVGTSDDGVVIYDPTTGVIENYNPTNSELTDPLVNGAIMDSHGTVWCSFTQNGVDAYNPTGFGPSATDAPISVRSMLNLSPNPTESTTTIAWQTTSATQDAMVFVFDAQGKRVQSLYLGSLAAGSHTYSIDLGALPTGTYHTVLWLDGRVQSGSVVKL